MDSSSAVLQPVRLGDGQHVALAPEGETLGELHPFGGAGYPLTEDALGAGRRQVALLRRQPGGLTVSWLSMPQHPTRLPFCYAVDRRVRSRRVGFREPKADGWALVPGVRREGSARSHGEIASSNSRPRRALGLEAPERLERCPIVPQVISTFWSFAPDRRPSSHSDGPPHLADRQDCSRAIAVQKAPSAV